jgi:hypothetical protein
MYRLPGTAFEPLDQSKQLSTDSDFTGFNMFNGDFILADTGALEKVAGVEKVKRDVKKLLNSDRVTQANALECVVDVERYNPNYGTFLRDHSRFDGLGSAEILTTINAMVESALTYYVNLQKQQTNVRIDELVDHFDYVTAYDPYRPQVVVCRISVVMASGQTFQLTSPLEV